MANYNQAFVKSEIGRIMKNSPGTQKFLFNAASAKLTAYKDDLIEEFTNSNITQEIIQETAAENISDTLGGEGNLYSFIGFESSEPNPAEGVPDYLRENIKLEAVGKYRNDARSTIIEFPVIVPSEDDLDKAFPMPWEPGTWLLKISTGISGLGEYLFHRYFRKGRSKAGLQMEYEVRENEFKPQPYFNKMLAKFVRKIR